MTARIELDKRRNSRGEQIEHLVINDEIWMSNEDVEYKDIERAIATAKGDCLIGGLGLFLIGRELLKKPEVNHVRIIEINQDVINLIIKKHGFKKCCGHWVLWKDDQELETKCVIEYGNFLDKFHYSTEYFKKEYDWIYNDIYEEPTKENYEMIKKWIPLAQTALKSGGTIEYWERPRMEQGKFI